MTKWTITALTVSAMIAVAALNPQHAAIVVIFPALALAWAPRN